MKYEIGFTAGAFDLLHAGHILMLKECKNYCNELIVGLHTDPSIDRSFKNKPVQTTYERYIQLTGCKYVDGIIPYDTEKDLENILATQNFNVRFVGEDYFDKPITGSDICKIKDIKILYITRLHNYSSTELRNRIKVNNGL